MNVVHIVGPCENVLGQLLGLECAVFLDTTNVLMMVVDFEDGFSKGVVAGKDDLAV